MTYLKKSVENSRRKVKKTIFKIMTKVTFRDEGMIKTKFPWDFNKKHFHHDEKKADFSILRETKSEILLFLSTLKNIYIRDFQIIKMFDIKKKKTFSKIVEIFQISKKSRFSRFSHSQARKKFFFIQRF